MAGDLRFVIVGGVNGCGKSSFATTEGSDVLPGQTAINPDDLTREAVASCWRARRWR